MRTKIFFSKIGARTRSREHVLEDMEVILLVHSESVVGKRLLREASEILVKVEVFVLFFSKKSFF